MRERGIHLVACARLLVLPACWHGGTSDEPWPQPAHAHVHRGVVTAHPAISDREPLAGEAFATQLRSTGPADLPTYATGPVILLDMNHRTVGLERPQFTILCGDAAVVAAHDWGVKLANPSRAAPTCDLASGSTALACTQVALDSRVIVFDDAGSPRITGLVITTGDPRRALDLLRRSRMPGASCP
ncbi:MAG: hypothetical protein NT062_26840 [Proteobacteria bacterium]|nr:hypothetical protein [Pseudomonadota bacterium]